MKGRLKNKVNERRKEAGERGWHIFHSISQRSSYNRVLEQDARGRVYVFFHVVVLQVMLCVPLSVLYASKWEVEPLVMLAQMGWGVVAPCYRRGQAPSQVLKRGKMWTYYKASDLMKGEVESTNARCVKPNNCSNFFFFLVYWHSVYLSCFAMVSILITWRTSCFSCNFPQNPQSTKKNSKWPNQIIFNKELVQYCTHFAR